MTSRTVAGLATVLLLGSSCGDEAEDPAEKLVGGWYAEDASGLDCATFFFFEDDGTYEIDHICALANGGYGAEGWVGNYQYDGDETLLMTNTHSTCADGDRNTETVVALVRDDRLTLTTGGITFALDRLPEGDDGGLGATILHGCWADDGSLVPGELVEL